MWVAPDGGGYIPAKVDVQTIVLATQHDHRFVAPIIYPPCDCWSHEQRGRSTNGLHAASCQPDQLQAPAGDVIDDGPLLRCICLLLVWWTAPAPRHRSAVG